MAKFTFKTDTARLRNWLNKRKSSLEQARQPFEATWKDIRSYFEPSFGKALLGEDVNQLAAQRDDDKIVNTTPRILLHRMNAGLQSGITNQSRQWFRLQPQDKKLNKLSAVRSWLDDTTERLWAIMNRSNVYQALDSTYIYCGGFGTACGLLVPDEQHNVHFHILDLGSYWIAEDKRGRVNTVMHKKAMTLAQMAAEFGEGWLTDQHRQNLEDGRSELTEMVWCYVGPTNADLVKDVLPSRQFMSIYWTDPKSDDNSNGILAIRSFDYNPIIAPRWSSFGSVYGTGVGHIGLADAKQLQQLEADILRLVELEVDPPMAVPSSMKGTPVDTGAGGITYYTDTLQRGVPVQRLYETRQNIQAVIMARQETEARLRQTFFADLFAMMINLNLQPKQMTAREVNELSGEKVALLGPILTRLNNDLLNPLVDAIFYLAIEQGLLDEPPEALRGQELRVEYVSSLHIEQAASSRISGLYRIFEFAGSVAQFKPDVLDKLDSDKAVSIVAEGLVEHGVVRDQKDVDAMRDARAKQQQAAMQAEMQAKQLQAAGSAAKNLSEAQVGQGSMLDVALEQGAAQ